MATSTAAGEEIGWRGYMLTRLIDAGVPRPVLVSGLIWGLWHVPLILGGVIYADSPSPALAATLFMVSATSFAYVLARLRLETGSILGKTDQLWSPRRCAGVRSEVPKQDEQGHTEATREQTHSDR